MNMEEDRPEYAEAIQVGKRRSSLGALSKSKPVTKLKSMFEAKGPGPKIKDAGLLGKLKPVSVSHDGSSFAAAVSASMAAPPPPKILAAPTELPPATPPEPLFSVMTAHGEQDSMLNLSPARSVEEMRTSVPGYIESVHDGSETDARSAKSPSSAGFLKRMSSSLKKALTPKSSAGKHKHGGCSPGYAGSEASNLSPRPSAQLLMTPSSQPSSTSLDLNIRSDQLQGAAPRSPPALLGYEVHGAQDDPEWSLARSHEGAADMRSRPIPCSGRPPRSPSMTPGASGSLSDCMSAQQEASPRSASRDVAPRLPATGSPDQLQTTKAIAVAGGPVAPEDSFISADSHGAAGTPATAAGIMADGEDSFAASLTASPTVPDGSEVSRGSPPMREVNMGAAIFSPPPFPSPSEHDAVSNGDAAVNGQGGELVFPSLASSDLSESVAQPAELASLADATSASGAAAGPAHDEPNDVDMAASDTAVPASEKVSAAADAVAAAATSCMEVDDVRTQLETTLQPPLPLASRRSFGAAASLNLDLSNTTAAIGGPVSPDASTPTTEADNVGMCIIGLTPVRPETAGMNVMNVDTPALSTVAEGSPEASPPTLSVHELRGMDLEGDVSQSHALHEVDVEETTTCNAGDELPQSASWPEQLSCGGISNAAAAAAAAVETRPFEPASPERLVPEVLSRNIISTSAMQPAADMDWDDNSTAVVCGVTACALPPQQACVSSPDPPSVTEVAAVDAECAMSDDHVHTEADGADAPSPTLVAKEVVCSAEPLNRLSASPGPSVLLVEADNGLPPGQDSALDKEHVAVSGSEFCIIPVTDPDNVPVDSTLVAVVEEKSPEEGVIPAAEYDVSNCRNSNPVPEERADSVCTVAFGSESVAVAAPEAFDDVQDPVGTVTESTPAVLELADEVVADRAEVSPAVASASASLQPAEAVAALPVDTSGQKAPADAAGQAPLLQEAEAKSEAPEDKPVSPAPTDERYWVAGRPEHDVDMEDAEGCSTGASALEMQESISATVHGAQVNLPCSPTRSPMVAQLTDDVLPVDSVLDGSLVAGSPEDSTQAGPVEATTSTPDAAQEVLTPQDVQGDEASATSAAAEQVGARLLHVPDEAAQEVSMYAVAEDLQAHSAVSELIEDHTDSQAILHGNNAVISDDAVVGDNAGAASLCGEVARLGPQQAFEPDVASAFQGASSAAAAAVGGDIQAGMSADACQPLEQDTDLMDVDSSVCATKLQQAEKCTVEAGSISGPATDAACEPEAKPTETLAANPQEAISEKEVLAEVGQQMQPAPVIPAGADMSPGVEVPSAAAFPCTLRYQQQSSDYDQLSYQQQSTEYDLAAYGSARSDLSLMDATSTFAAEGTRTENPSGLCGPAVAIPQQESAVSEPAVGALSLQPDDPMMVSPMPLRMSAVPPLCLAQEPSLPPVSPDGGELNAPPSAAQSAGTPGMPTPISPETARLGVRAFQLDDIEEPEVGAKSHATAEAPIQDQEPTAPVDDETAMNRLKPADELPQLQSSSPLVNTTSHEVTVPAAGPLHTEDAAVLSQPAAAVPLAQVDLVANAASAPSATAPDVPARGSTASYANAAVLASSTATPDVVSSLPSVSAPPALAISGDVPMADSLEAIEALWGNDDLLAEDGTDTAGLVPLPQIASSPVSASKQSESPVLHPGRKVAPGVVLQVQRESLDLFSLRKSCTARVSDSLMVESLDSFENMGLCAKSRAVGFIPMAPLKEANEHDEEAAAAGLASGSEGGSAPSSAGAQSPSVTFAADTRGSPESLPTPVLSATSSADTSGDGTPCASKPAAGTVVTRSGINTPAAAAVGAAGQSKTPASILKSATPVGTARVNATPTTALKAMAAAGGAGQSAAKAGMHKRAPPVAAPQTKSVATPGQAVAGPAVAPSGSRLPGFTATPMARGPIAGTPFGKPPMPSQAAAAATPGAAPGRPGITPRSGGVFTSGTGQPPASGIRRPDQCPQQPTPAPQPGSSGPSLFDTPLILRAAAVPLTDTPFSGCDFDLDTVDISAEACKAIAALGASADSTNAAVGGTATQHRTPGVAPTRSGVVAGTPTISVLETHVQLLTNKLAQAEADIHQLQDENAMLRDQLSTLQFENSMTNDLDMEREARQFLEQELAVVRHRSDGLEADLRAAHLEVKRREQAAADLMTAQQTKEAEWARKEAELQLRIQQITLELEAARSFAQQADARITEAEARSAAATAKCDEETARSRELQVTLGLQAHQLVQVQRARDDSEAKFQRAMEQLIAAQTSHKKAVVEYEQKLQHMTTLTAQFNEARDRYRQMKQHAAESDQRASQAEAKVQEATAALNALAAEKKELLEMCNQLLNEMEKAKRGR